MIRIGLLSIGLAACGLAADGPAGFDAGHAGNDADPCTNVLVFDPAAPVAGDHIKVTAQVLGPGVLDYAWSVDGVPTTSYEAADHSAIGFDAPIATSHTVAVAVSPGSGCRFAQGTINVASPNGMLVMYRVRLTPPAELAPPQETRIQIHGGQSTDRPFAVDPGTVLSGAVTAGGPVPAYVELRPVLGPAIELVTTGTFVTRLALQTHTVLVIPQSNALAPRLFTWMPGMGPDAFPVDPGTPVTGTVVDRGGGPLANAQVQLEQLGVPSTIATTATDGTFTAHHTFDPTDPITVTVTPPASSGLPRLTATAPFDLAGTLRVSYTASPALCDLGGTRVTRAAAPRGHATVTVVGALAGTAGTIATGTMVASATGNVHIAAIASGAGVLPTTLVPRAPLAAVIEVAAGDFAVAPLDTSACAAQSLDAPAGSTAAGTIYDAAGTTKLPGARAEATPIGALARVTLVPAEAVADGEGGFAFPLAAGAHYALHFFDPGGRAAPHDDPDETAAGVPSEVRLARAIAITGQVTVIGFPNPVANASVQILCDACTGVAARAPVAQTATDVTGAYRIAVPDPGPR